MRVNFGCQPIARKKFSIYASRMELNSLIKRAGSVRAIAEALGLTTQAVYKWGGTIPKLRVYELKELRPAWFKGGRHK